MQKITKEVSPIMALYKGIMLMSTCQNERVHVIKNIGLLPPCNYCILQDMLKNKIL
jgi:hypothetical protein